MKHSKATWITAALAAGTIFVHLLIVLALTRHGLCDILRHALSLSQLAEYGESFAPVTAIFAAAAAVFAALAFRTQRATSDREVERDQRRMHSEAVARFDMLFFQATKAYDEAKAILDRNAKLPSRSASAHRLLRELKDSYQRGDIFPLDTAPQFWKENLGMPRYKPVLRFMRAVYALVRWMETAAAGEDVRLWMDLFETRMSKTERFVIGELIQEHAPVEVRVAASTLGIFKRRKSTTSALQ